MNLSHSNLKTLVIHLDDPSTYFLHKIYERKENMDVINNASKFTTETLKEKMKEYDRILLLGHGCPDGLFNNRNGIEGVHFVVDGTFSEILSKKDVVAVFCNADLFLAKFKIKASFYSGMFISEVSEARGYDIFASEGEIEFSNYLFSSLLGLTLNMDPVERIDLVKESYVSETSLVIDVNRNWLYSENTGGNTRLKKLKQIYFSFYDQMDEPEKTKAKIRFDIVHAISYPEPRKISDAIMSGFLWNKFTNEGFEYWKKVSDKYA